MQLDHRPTKILISGNSGCGKSTFATRYVLNCPHTIRFIFDPEGEFSFRNGFPAATTPETLFEQLPSGWVIFDSSDLFPGDGRGGFDFFSEWAFQISRGLEEDGRQCTKLFFCDELQNFVETTEAPWGLRLILETGRRYGLDTLLVTQQPNVIHNRARNQLTELVAFSQVDENAVAFLEDQGFDGEEVRGLPPGEFVLKQLRSRTWVRGNVFTGRRSVWRFGGSRHTGPVANAAPTGVQGPSLDGPKAPGPENPVSAPPAGSPPAAPAGSQAPP